MPWSKETQHVKLVNVKLESTEILEISFILFIFSDSCHKKMFLESLNIPLNNCCKMNTIIGNEIISCCCKTLISHTWYQYFGIFLLLNCQWYLKLQNYMYVKITVFMAWENVNDYRWEISLWKEILMWWFKMKMLHITSIYFIISLCIKSLLPTLSQNMVRK